VREVALGGDHRRRVTTAEDVVAAAMALVELSRVAAVEVAHTQVKVRLRRLDDQVVPVGEQAVRAHAPSITARDADDELDEAAPILRVAVDRRAAVPASRDVVTAAGEQWTT
jgi:riboflavin biosynthesis pyrimidine reductase